MAEYRHEQKYLCSQAELKNLEIRLKTLMLPDIHAQNGKYFIRSIYFDDIYNSRFEANEAGESPREKWRIRAYNADSSFIILECKRKEHGMIKKTSCKLDMDTYDLLLRGEGTVSNNNDALLNKFVYEQNISLLKPVVIVQYIRRPYVYPLGNVRVTFDMNISSSNEIDHFFDEHLSGRPILGTGMHLLEVKYDEFIPDHIFHGIQMDDMQQIAFSKYSLCRKYNRGISFL